MGNKTTQNLSFPLHDVNPHLIQQCLGPSHAPPQTAAPTVETLSHTDAVNSPLVTMARPKCVPENTPCRGPIPKPTTCLIPRPVRPMMPNCIRIRLHWTDRRTYARIDRPTDRSGESLTTIGRCAPRATRPSNNNTRFVERRGAIASEALADRSSQLARNRR